MFLIDYDRCLEATTSFTPPFFHELEYLIFHSITCGTRPSHRAYSMFEYLFKRIDKLNPPYAVQSFFDL